MREPALGPLPIAFMTSALDHPFVASAEPNNGSNANEWDIEKYDGCMSHMPGDVEPVSWDMYCCTNSGWVDHNKHICAAPPGDSQPIGGIPPNRIPTTVLLPPPSTPEARPPGSVG